MKSSNKQSNNKQKETVLIRHDLTLEQQQEIKEAFDSIDLDGSGKLDVEELKVAMKALGLDNRKDETDRIIQDMDKNKDGQISYEEFLDLLTMQITDKNHDAEIRKIHSYISDENSQKISVASLKNLCEELGEEISDEEIKEMVEEADLDRDGEVDINDFFALMKKISVF